MGGAVIFNIVSFKVLKNKKPICAAQNFLPTKTKSDRNLILGAVLFGIGWGISGFCPGPALVNLVTFSFESILFVVSMVAGMSIYKLFEKNLNKA